MPPSCPVAPVAVAPVVPKVLKAVGLDYTANTIVDQLGGYEGKTNPSFAMLVRPNDLKKVLAATYLTGFGLSQKGMMTISHRPFEGAMESGLITIKLPKGATQGDVHAVYTRLIAKLGERIQGHTTGKGEMLIADVLGEESEKLSKKIQRALRGEFGVSYDGGFVGFLGMDDYDFIGSDTAETTTGIDRDVAAKIRAEATKLRDGEISKRIGIAKG